MSLKQHLAEIAHQVPETRVHILPIIRVGSFGKKTADIWLDIALDKLHAPLNGWVFYGSAGDKKELMETYQTLRGQEKAALTKAVKRAMGQKATMYRRLKPGQKPSSMGGMSLHIDNPKMGTVHAFEVAASDVLLHPDVPGTPLASKAFGHEREAILKPDARPRYLGIVHDDLARQAKSLGKKEAFNKENPTELMGQLLKVLTKRGLDDVVDIIRKNRIPQKINDAWLETKGMSADELALLRGRVRS